MSQQSLERINSAITGRYNAKQICARPTHVLGVYVVAAHPRPPPLISVTCATFARTWSMSSAR